MKINVFLTNRKLLSTSYICCMLLFRNKQLWYIKIASLLFSDVQLLLSHYGVYYLFCPQLLLIGRFCWSLLCLGNC